VAQRPSKAGRPSVSKDQILRLSVRVCECECEGKGKVKDAASELESSAVNADGGQTLTVLLLIITPKLASKVSISYSPGPPRDYMYCLLNCCTRSVRSTWLVLHAGTLH
jgi:hypothetical protein